MEIITQFRPVYEYLTTPSVEYRCTREMRSKEGGTDDERIFFFSFFNRQSASNRYFPRLGDRKIKSATEETLLSRSTLCSRSLPLLPFARTTIRSSETLFPFYDLTSSSSTDSTRLDSTRFVSTPRLLPIFSLSPSSLGGVNTLCPNKKTLNCCAAYYEKSLGSNDGIREKLLRNSLHDNRGPWALCCFV